MKPRQLRDDDGVRSRAAIIDRLGHSDALEAKGAAANAPRTSDAIGLVPTTQRLKARTSLFASGDAARNYYVLQSGELIVVRRQGGSKPRIRFLYPGDIFIFACGALHVANCDSLYDSAVLRFDRWQLDRMAASNAALTCLLSAMHATELEMILP